MTAIDDGAFKGYASLFCIDEVKEPLFRSPAGETVCLADNGYKWLQHFPEGERYTLTTIFDECGEVVRWYVDICNRHFLDENGVLCYEDLYLDIDVAFDGSATILDADELDEALRAEHVTSLQYEIAWREVEKLVHAIESDMFPLLWQGTEHKDRLLSALDSR